MIGKLAVLLLLASSCFAESSDVSIELLNDKHIEIDKVIKLIHSYIDKLRDTVKNAHNLVANLQENIHSVVDGLDIPGIIHDLNEAIKEILDAAEVSTGKARVCIKAKRKAVNKLVKNANKSVSKCVKDADNSVKRVLNLVVDIEVKTSAIIAKEVVEVNKCFKHFLPSKKLKCLLKLAESFRLKMEDILVEINEFIDEIQDIITDIVHNTNDCITLISNDVSAAKYIIIETFRECVNDIAEKTV